MTKCPLHSSHPLLLSFSLSPSCVLFLSLSSSFDSLLLSGGPLPIEHWWWGRTMAGSLAGWHGQKFKGATVWKQGENWHCYPSHTTKGSIKLSPVSRTLLSLFIYQRHGVVWCNAVSYTNKINKALSLPCTHLKHLGFLGQSLAELHNALWYFDFYVKSIYLFNVSQNSVSDLASKEKTVFSKTLTVLQPYHLSIQPYPLLLAQSVGYFLGVGRG